MSHKQDAQSQEQVSAHDQVDNFKRDAFNRHDANALAAVLTDDTVFEDTSPARDGRRIEGKGRRGRVLARMVRA